MAKSANGEMTIRELAERTGMTVRNIRAHQTRGLLPPPVVRGRTGYYNEEHVVRIELTREMQADGLNLEAIRRVLESGDGSAAADLRFHPRPADAVRRRGPGDRTMPARWPESGGERVELGAAAAGEKLGIYRTLPDGQIEVISPRLQQAAAELAGLGVGPEAAMATAEKLRRHADGAARAFVELFVGGDLGPVRRRPAAPSRTGRGSARRSNGCDRLPPGRCWRSSRSRWERRPRRRASGP